MIVGLVNFSLYSKASSLKATIKRAISFPLYQYIFKEYHPQEGSFSNQLCQWLALREYTHLKEEHGDLLLVPVVGQESEKSMMDTYYDVTAVGRHHNQVV